MLYAIPSYDRISVPLNIRLSTSALVGQINELGVKLIIGDQDAINRLKPFLHKTILTVNFAHYREWCQTSYDGILLVLLQQHQNKSSYIM